VFTGIWDVYGVMHSNSSILAPLLTLSITMNTAKNEGTYINNPS
jgi:hypothetical protein